jgi:hypothetical protein
MTIRKTKPEIVSTLEFYFPSHTFHSSISAFMFVKSTQVQITRLSSCLAVNKLLADALHELQRRMLQADLGNDERECVGECEREREGRSSGSLPKEAVATGGEVQEEGQDLDALPGIDQQIENMLSEFWRERCMLSSPVRKAQEILTTLSSEQTYILSQEVPTPLLA